MDTSDPNFQTSSELQALKLENEQLKAMLEAKSGNVLNHLPVAIWEEDFSEVKRFFNQLSDKGVVDFDAHLKAHPNDVAHCASLIKVVSVNQAAMQMTGLATKPDSVDDLPRFFNEESETVFRDEFIALASGRTAYRSEAVTVDYESRRMQIIFQVNVVPGHEEDLSKVLVTVTEVTDQAVLRRELDRSKIQWQAIFESLVDGVMIIDRNLNILQTNYNTVDRPTGEEPIGKSIVDEVIPEQRDEAAKFFRSVFSTGEPAKAEHRSAFSNGKLVFSVVASPMKVNGSVDHLVVVARNMTEQKKTEKELAMSEARWRSIFNYASDLVFIVDKDMVVTVANDPALRIISDRMIGNKLHDVIMPGNARVVRSMINEVFQTRQRVQTIVEIVEGEYKGHQYSCDISTLPDESGEISAIIIARDVTESKNLEKRVLDALIQGQERERNRVARELHDGLGQLFTALNMNMQLFKLRNKATLDNQAKDQLEELSGIVSMAISEVKGISRNLLPDVLNHHGLIPAMKDVIHALESGMVDILLDDVDAERRYPPKVELAIFRAFQELLNNAVKYAEAKTIHVQLVDHESSIALSIEDDGVGIAEEDQTSGHGIGNINARAEALGGTFHVEGAPGKGTLAYIEIPINN